MVVFINSVTLELYVTEYSLHSTLKEYYSRECDSVEVEVSDYVVDVAREGILIEIQTGSFSNIRDKIVELIDDSQVRLVYPISFIKWIVRLDRDSETVLSRRRSPKRGRLEEVFYELVYMPKLIENKNLELEVLLINSEEYLINDGRGSWRRRGWSVHDRKLVDVLGREIFEEPKDFARLLPEALPFRFTARELRRAAGISANLAQKMVYTLRHMGVLSLDGRKGRAYLYAKNY